MSRRSRGPLTLLIDTNNLVARIYYGLGARSADLTPGAEARTVRAKIQQFIDLYQPQYVLAGLDGPAHDLVRREMDSKYKRGAGTQPEPLRRLLQEGAALMDEAGAVPVHAARHEADDVIATLARHAPGDVVIVSGDRDLYTLIKEGVQVHDLHSGELVGETQAREQFGGVPPRLLPFYQALRGDLRGHRMRRAMFGRDDAARLAGRYETPARLYAAWDELSEADRAVLSQTTSEALEQGVELHTLNDHAPTALAGRPA